jgi:hypothetical protein
LYKSLTISSFTNGRTYGVGNALDPLKTKHCQRGIPRGKPKNKTAFSSQICHHLNVIDKRGLVDRRMVEYLQSQTGRKIEKGFWSAIYVRECDAWKTRMQI